MVLEIISNFLSIFCMGCWELWLSWLLALLGMGVRSVVSSKKTILTKNSKLSCIKVKQKSKLTSTVTKFQAAKKTDFIVIRIITHFFLSYLKSFSLIF